MEYDVIIVGGGPGGAWLCRELANNGVKVLLLERSSIPGEPNFSSGGSPLSIIKDFEIPEEAVATEWNTLRLTNESESTITYEHGIPAGVVFDFKKLKILLLEKAKEYGADIKIGVSAKSYIQKNEKVFITTSDNNEYSCRIAEDASGLARVFSHSLNKNEIKKNPCVAIEILFNAPNAPTEQQDILDFYWGREALPHGYGWIFPMGRTLFKVGVCIYYLNLFKPTINLDELLGNFVNRFKWLDGSTVIEKHGGTAFGDGNINKLVHENILIVGDAGDTINPLGLEGIRHAFQTAKYASKPILEVIKYGKSLSVLNNYQKSWSDYAKRNWFLAKIFSIIVYRYMGKRGFRTSMNWMKKYSPRESLQILFGYKFRILALALIRIRPRAKYIIHKNLFR